MKTLLFYLISLFIIPESYSAKSEIQRCFDQQLFKFVPLIAELNLMRADKRITEEIFKWTIEAVSESAASKCVSSGTKVIHNWGNK